MSDQDYSTTDQASKGDELPSGEDALLEPSGTDLCLRVPPGCGAFGMHTFPESS